MSWRRWLAKIGALFHRRKPVDDLEEEIRSHLAMEEQENLEAGMPPDEAHYAALRRFGNVTQTKERSREMWGWQWLETLLQDLRYGLRQLRRNPGFTAVAVLTLALGIGGTTAIFNVIYGVLLHPFPWKDNDRLVAVVTHDPDQPEYDGWAAVSPSEFLDFRKQNNVFDQTIGGVTIDGRVGLLMTSPNKASDMFWGARVTPNAFRVLGLRPILGRAFTAADCKPGAAAVVLLGYKTWQSRFGANPGILGQTIFLNHQPTAVIGVMPPHFTGIGEWSFHDSAFPFDGWLPAVFSRTVPKDPDELWWLIGHLKPGVTVAQASSDIAFLAKRFAAVYPKQHPNGITFSCKSFTECERDPSARMALGMLMGGVGLLLLIACVNVANLLLARASTREHEIAIRAAIGAGRVRLVRQLLIESLLLACGGALLGGLIAWILYKGVVSVLPSQYVYSELQIRASAMNAWVLLFAVGIALASTLVFGLAPAVLAVKKDLQAPLKATGRRTGETRGHNRLRNMLVVSEVVLSLVLLMGAGLLFRSFWALQYVDLGYSANNVLQATAKLPEARYKTAEQRNQFHLEVLRHVRSLPGVASAALADLLYNPPDSIPIEIPGQTGAKTRMEWKRFVGDGFFATMRIPLIRGRTFSEEDMDLSRPVTVVNRAFVDKYLSDVNPLGRQIKVGKTAWYPQMNGRVFEIVGVVGDTLNDSGGYLEAKPQIFFPYTVGASSWTILFIRARGHLESLPNPVRKAFSAVDKELVAYTSPVRRAIEHWYVEPDFIMGMLAGFALLGMVLVCIGVYGVLSYAVSQRTQEIGVRMALGAQVADVRRMVMKWGLRWLAIGIGIGIPASIALEKVLRNRIWGITSADPLTLVVVSLVLTAVAMLACYIPARRAAKVDPMVALRYE